MVRLRYFRFNFFSENTWLAWTTGPECVVVDPGFNNPEESGEFFAGLREEGLTPAAILLTHGHVDHIYGVAELLDHYDIPVYLSAEDAPTLVYDKRMSRLLRQPEPRVDFKYNDITDGQLIKAAGLEFEVIRTPGHSPGGSCFLERREKIMFTGDTLFAGTIGRTDLEGGEYDDLIRSIMEKLMFLDPDITIIPGHGGTSTIGQERTTNPFLEPFNEKEEEIDG